MVRLGDVAPAKPIKLKGYSPFDKIWHVTLDQIESNTGYLFEKSIKLLSEAGSSTHAFDDRHVLYSKLRPYLNKVLLPDQTGLGTTELVPMLPDANKLDRIYLAHYLKSKFFVNWISNQTAGAKMPRVTMHTFWNHEIPLPPLPEQKRIAAILDQADEIRRDRELAIAKLDQLAQSIFVEMFGDPVVNPMGWGVKKWGDVLNIINGKNQKKVEVLNGTYPIYGSAGNEMGRANDYLCAENSIIIGRKGNINKPVLVKEKFWNVDTAFGLNPNNELLSALYLYWFCNFFNFERLNKTVTIPSLTKSDLLNIEIPLPPIALQEIFTSRIEALEQLKADNNAALAKHNILFASLQHSAFTGQL